MERELGLEFLPSDWLNVYSQENHFLFWALGFLFACFSKMKAIKIISGEIFREKNAAQCIPQNLCSWNDGDNDHDGISHGDGDIGHNNTITDRDMVKMMEVMILIIVTSNITPWDRRIEFTHSNKLKGLFPCLLHIKRQGQSWTGGKWGTFGICDHWAWKNWAALLKLATCILLLILYFEHIYPAF